jgi:hypothetical protein
MHKRSNRQKTIEHSALEQLVDFNVIRRVVRHSGQAFSITPLHLLLHDCRSKLISLGDQVRLRQYVALAVND